MRVGFFGSGAFGLPTLQSLIEGHEITFVVSQPDRPAGRRRQLRATPISELALENGCRLLRPERLGASEIDTIRSIETDVWVVIAYGLKLPPELLLDRFACNLHGSVLPRWRGAAPIQRCLMAGDEVAGVSVITLAEVMDAGQILGTVETPVDPLETAGELHDRLATYGPEAVGQVLSLHESGSLEAVDQDESFVTHAAKLSRAEATVDFNQPASRVRGWIHGLTPWPGCDVSIDSSTVRIKRVKDHGEEESSGQIGCLVTEDRIQCQSGCIEILEVQPAGGRPMSWQDYCRGRDIKPGVTLESV
ncbi:MAG: methionyl-tRNA formyltransferase [Phycisphaerales bacterium]|nr:methionyl-tRNA formyltransferase [Phycisphaerales bacterium]